jgi:HD-like signal output (HDOD) protein
MKVLIVDDQLASRKKVQKIFEGFCTADAVDCGRAALDACRKSWEDNAPYQLITLDISMPDMDGMEVLQIIREQESQRGISKEEQAKVLMITSSSDKDTVVTCIQAGCDDYLVKPLNRETISAKLEKFGMALSRATQSENTLRKMVETTIERFNRGDIELPVIPQVVREIQSTMDDAGSTIETIAKVIEKDPSISLKLIATANSPIFRGVEKIDTVTKAISRIGLKDVQDLVSTIANKSLYETKNRQLKQLLDKLWLHSMACAHAARLISGKVAREFTPRAFLGGLVHDIGSVLLLKSLGEIISPKRDLDQDELVTNVWEVHTSFGAALLEKWDYSEELVKLAKFHEWTQFEPDTEISVLVIHLADNLAHSIGFGFFDKGEIDLLALDATRLLKIDADTLDDISKALSAVMSESATGVGVS